MKIYWGNNKYLVVNGEKLLSEEAYEKYPNDANEIKNFVEESDFMDMVSGQISFESDISNDSKTNISVKCCIIEDKINQIFSEMNIRATPEADASKNAFKLFKYVIEHSQYDSSIMDEKAIEDKTQLSTIVINDIYRCLIEGRSVCTSDAAALSLLYRRAGIPSRHITIAEKGDVPQNVHEVVMLELDGKNLICDPTLTRTAVEEGQVPEIDDSVFAFTPDTFFGFLYPTREIKYIHEPLMEI